MALATRSLFYGGRYLYQPMYKAASYTYGKQKSTWIPDNLPKYINGCNSIPELENANDMVKKIFSLEEASNKELRRVVAAMNKDKYDTILEKNIANNTCQIRMMVESLQCAKNPAMKVFLIWVIDQRKKLLRKLQKIDVEKYESIVKELDIPPLQDPLAKHNKYKFRKFKINVPLVKRRKIEDFEKDRVY